MEDWLCQILAPFLSIVETNKHCKINIYKTCTMPFVALWLDRKTQLADIMLSKCNSRFWHTNILTFSINCNKPLMWILEVVLSFDSIMIYTVLSLLWFCNSLFPCVKVFLYCVVWIILKCHQVIVWLDFNDNNIYMSM